MSDIRIYTAAQAGGLTPLTGDIILCSEAFNGAPANSVHLALAGGATPTWKSFANDASADALVLAAFYDTEAEILARSGDPDRTIAYAADTQNLYVYNGTAWYIYKNDDIIGNNDFNAA